MLPSEFESHLSAFETAWLSDRSPDWHEYFSHRPNGPTQQVSDLLRELVAIDMEIRWSRGIGCLVEDYISIEPRVQEPTLLMDLIVEEYRVRCRFSKPSRLEFEQRFPNMVDLLGHRLSEVDDERQSETTSYRRSSSNRIQKLELTRNVPDLRATLPFDDYLLERFIGSGGSGKVYLARKKACDQQVAVKFLKKSFQDQPDVVERFIGEVKFIERLRHEGIVKLHGLGQTQSGGYFFVMKWLAAGDLNRQIQNGVVSVYNAARWVGETAQAIQYAHEHGVVHCDLKPANILLNSLGHAVVTDFGLARSSSQVAENHNGIEGTVSYMAFEQAFPGHGKISHLTDIYGMGAILYALLSGQAPFVGRRPSDVLSQMFRKGPVPNPSLKRDLIPPELEAICLQCLSRDPSQRPDSSKEVAERIQNIIEKSGLGSIQSEVR